MVSFIIGLLLSLGLITSENEYHSKSESQKSEMHRQADWGTEEHDGL